MILSVETSPIRLVSSVWHPDTALETKVAIVALLQVPIEHALANQASTVPTIEDPLPSRSSPDSIEASIHLASSLAAIFSNVN